MNSLTTQAIQDIGRQFHFHKMYDITTAAYVQYLLQPYAEAIEQAQSIDSIKEWIPLAFPGELAKNADLELIKSEITNNIEIVKRAVIEYFIGKILKLAGDIAEDQNDITILPWDVQKAISSDPELSIVFGIMNDPKTLKNGEPHLLPVTINGYTHYLSRDFVAGLLLFSSIINHDFGILMFGAPLNHNYIIGTNRYTSDNTTVYTVVIPNSYYNYTFNSPEFMQGFATGAEWVGVDHHNYWSNLLQESETGDEFEITF